MKLVVSMLPGGVVVDIVMPVHGALQYVRRAVDSLFRWTSRDDFRFIIVDDQSNGGTREYLNYLGRQGWADVYHTPERYWFTGTCNLGLKQSSAPYAILLNSDVEVGTGWLLGLVSCSLKNDAGIVGCKLVFPNGKIWHAGAYGQGGHVGIFEYNHHWFEERSVEWVTGAILMIRRDVLDKIGLLDEKDAHVASDMNYCLKAAEAGFSIWYSPVALTHHVGKSAPGAR